jgi:GMP reductase
MTREITFCHSKQKFKGVPIMASNMDTVGTFEMALALGEVSFIVIRIMSNLEHL